MKKLLLLALAVAGGINVVSADDTWTLRGDFNDWGSGDVFDSNGKLEVIFTTGKTVSFKIVKNGSEWYGYNGNVTYSDNNNLSFSTSSGNCYLIAGEAGTYTFSLNTTGDAPSLSISYPEYTGKIYFYNSLGWVTPHVYILTTSYWDDKLGSGSNGRTNGIAMSQVGSTNVWEANCPSNIDADEFYIAFIDQQQDGYNNFWGANAAYRGDFKTGKPLFVPETSSTENHNSTTYYNDGSWHAYPTYTRSVTSGNFGTICLPFAATVSGATVYTITSKVMDGETLKGINLESVESLEAGKAYIFKATGETLTATYSGSYAEASAANGMIGNLGSTDVTVPQNNYVVGTDNLIHKVTGDAVTCGQYKAYITLSGVSEAKARGAHFIGFDEEATGIENVKAENGQETVYNLNGQRMAGSHKGLLIVNGKKLIKK